MKTCEEKLPIFEEIRILNDTNIKRHRELIKILDCAFIKSGGKHTEIKCDQLSFIPYVYIYVLEGVIGSSFKYGFHYPYGPRDDYYTLFRVSDERNKELEQLNLCTIVPLDRRHLYARDNRTGLYSLKATSYHDSSTLKEDGD